MQKISSKNVSIVVQGKNIFEHTEKCLKSLRKNFPYAEIIFSTYEDENIYGLDYDVLVTSPDPQAFMLRNNVYNNINRILTTTKAGLEKVSRKYCLKIRSDLFFDNDKLLADIASHFPVREKEFSIFHQRVLFYTLWTRKFEYLADKYYILTPFYLSDWMCFGLTEDIKLYFDNIPLIIEPDFSNYFKNPQHNIFNFDETMPWQFPPEQYFATSFFKKYTKHANMKSLQDFSKEKLEISKRFFASNIVVCGYKECGAYNQKSIYKFVSKNINFLKGIWLSGVYRYADFLADYKKYCDANFNIPIHYMWFLNDKIDKDIIKLHKHYKIFSKPIKIILRWVEQIFSISYYILKIAVNTIKIYITSVIEKYFLLFLLVYAF